MCNNERWLIVLLETRCKYTITSIGNFKDICLEGYEIDPWYTYSTPGLTLSTGLRKTNIHLKHSKEDKYDLSLILEKGIRGDVSTILGDRYVRALNRYTIFLNTFN